MNSIVDTAKGESSDGWVKVWDALDGVLVAEFACDEGEDGCVLS